MLCPNLRRLGDFTINKSYFQCGLHGQRENRRRCPRVREGPGVRQMRLLKNWVTNLKRMFWLNSTWIPISGLSKESRLHKDSTNGNLNQTEGFGGKEDVMFLQSRRGVLLVITYHSGRTPLFTGIVLPSYLSGSCIYW